ncbi:putative RNA methyltransferase [Streptomyces sp. NPDC056716]|uniref:putative RNA methyltransferase n=1 Tax=unclassified Streptomyces TaxID=2593676 RepID=UPI003686B61C
MPTPLPSSQPTPKLIPPLPAPLDRILDLLRCPPCGAGLRPVARALRCPAGHTFDLARQGYAALLTGTRATSADTQAMVSARTAFLATGHYAPLHRAVSDLAADAAPDRRTVADAPPDRPTILDAGCGTAHYLAAVLDALPGARGLGLDASVPALRKAARAHPRAAAVAWDVFRPFPLADAAADVLLNVFAPRNPAEFHRVLRPDGRLIVVRPTARHLTELRERLPTAVTVDPAKETRLSRTLDPYFAPVRTERIEYGIQLTGREARDLVAMTPNARHLRHADAVGDGWLPREGRLTVSVLAGVYRPRPQPRRD